MILTLIGLVIFLAGLVIFFARDIGTAFVFFIFCTLFGGSAAFILPGLGYSSVQPAFVALMFLAMRIALPSRVAERPIVQSLRDNLWLGLFALWAVVTAIAMPRIFADHMNVVPMRPSVSGDLYETVPLRPTNQNITIAFYIVGTFFIALCSAVAIRQPLGAVRFVRIAVLVGWIHALLGATGALFAETFWGNVLNFFRNGSYAQVDQAILGFRRINGIMPETSTYAAYGFAWFVLLAELWLRSVQRGRTGPAALALLIVLIASTSSTAYAAIIVYMLIIAIRMLLFPKAFRAANFAWIVAVLFLSSVAIGLLILFKPELAAEFGQIFDHAVLSKAKSDSGLQRLFWARQGLDAFANSYGLGIGVGSFRSSSFLTAIIGSTGVVGCVLMTAYLVKTFRPLSPSTYGRPLDPIDSVGIAAGWGALGGLIPAALSSPSPDPGATFAIFAAVALSLRSVPRQRPLTDLAALELVLGDEAMPLSLPAR